MSWFRSIRRFLTPLAALALSLAAAACEDEMPKAPDVRFLRITVAERPAVIIEPNGAVVNGPLLLTQGVPHDVLFEVLDENYQPVLGEDFPEFRIAVVTSPGATFTAPDPQWTPQGNFAGTLTANQAAPVSFAVQWSTQGLTVFGPYSVNVVTEAVAKDGR